KFKSLELGVLADAGGGTNWSRMCYAGPDQPLPPEINPATAFTRLFGDLNTTPGMMVDVVAVRRKSVLDAVLAQYTYLKTRLGAEDGRKLESHFQSVREVETRLDVTTGGTATVTCTKPAAP